MPLYMDVHNMEGGVSATDVAKAHDADLATQAAHGVEYKRYWVDEKAPTTAFPASGDPVKRRSTNGEWMLGS